jgi:hypothetical protein
MVFSYEDYLVTWSFIRVGCIPGLLNGLSQLLTLNSYGDISIRLQLELHRKVCSGHLHNQSCNNSYLCDNSYL